MLIGNGEEPLYAPDSPFNRLIFTRDYYASALHEIAHWCIAGDERRKQVDYGYWYYPEGRNQDQQKLFESVEVKPQALEYLFSQAAGSPFMVSLDNFADGHESKRESFQQKVIDQAQRYLRDGLPNRAALFRSQLLAFYD